MDADGSVRCATSFPAQGQGHATTIAQVVADRLGIALGACALVPPDTRDRAGRQRDLRQSRRGVDPRHRGGRRRARARPAATLAARPARGGAGRHRPRRRTRPRARLPERGVDWWPSWRAWRPFRLAAVCRPATSPASPQRCPSILRADLLGRRARGAGGDRPRDRGGWPCGGYVVVEDCGPRREPDDRRGSDPRGVAQGWARRCWSRSSTTPTASSSPARRWTTRCPRADDVPAFEIGHLQTRRARHAGRRQGAWARGHDRRAGGPGQRRGRRVAPARRADRRCPSAHRSCAGGQSSKIEAWRWPALELIRRLEDNVGRVLVGKPEAIRLAVVRLLARGHLLIEDVPGVGKTTLAAALARSIGVGFQRIQFTSDMLPSDILGRHAWEPTRGEFVFKPGPLFTNVVLADEINRTTPRTQSSAARGDERGARCRLDHSTHPLPRPFMVLATQNPLEYEGTHPLPESPARSLPAAHPHRLSGRLRREGDPARRRRAGPGVAGDRSSPRPTWWISREQVDRVRADDSVLDYLMALVEATRHSPLLRLGVSPRARWRCCGRRAPARWPTAASSSCPTISRRWRCRRWPTACSCGRRPAARRGPRRSSARSPIASRSRVDAALLRGFSGRAGRSGADPGRMVVVSGPRWRWASPP